MKQIVEAQGETLDQTTRRVVWAMVFVMLLSFAFGIVMFIPSEHRTEKLNEMMAKYRARSLDADRMQEIQK